MGVLAFGEFEADPERFQLRRDGALVEISAKCFDVLLYLIRHRERVVSKAELVEKVWQTQALSASSVPTAVLALRKALGDDEDSARHVANVRGRGYRFVADVREADSRSVPASPASPASRTAGSARSSRSTFVGREPEMAALSAAFDRAGGGVPQMVLLAGEAGIGKTRTAEEFSFRARAWDATVLVGRCREGEGAPAFWPWVQIVRSLLEQTELAARKNDLRRLAPVLAQMVPEVASHFPGLAAPPPLDPEPARFRLFDTVTQLLQRVGSERPLVVVLDDLHRADPASLQLVAFVCRELREAKVLFLVTYRDVDAQRDPPRLSIISELARQEPSRSVQLHGLSALEVAAFVSTSALSDSTQMSLARVLHEQSGGNPFFLTQLVHLLEAEGSAAAIAEGRGIAGLLPGGIREAIARQIDGLPEDTRRALRVAATAGRAFSAAAVAEVLGLPVPRLIAALEAALDARMIVASDRLGHFRFAHVLLRDTIYEGVDAVERGALHQKIAETLERLYADDLGPHSAELAYHFLEAVHTGGTEPAVRYAVRAGEWASACLAYEDAARHYRSALQILEQAGPGNLVQRCETLLDLGEVEMHAGERERARQALYDAAALAKRAGHPDLLARAALRLAPGFFTIELGVFDSLLVYLLEDAIAALGPEDSSLRAQLLARLAMAHGWSGADEHRSRLTLEAIGVAERVGGPGSLAYALGAKHGLLWGPERLPERVALIETMGALAGRSKDTELILMHLLFRITAGLELGQIEAADRDIARYTDIAEALNRPQSLWYTHSFRAARALMQGKFADAAVHAQRLLSIGARIHDANSLNSFGINAAIQLWEQGRAAEILPFADQYVDRYPLIQGWRFSRAAMYFEAGRVSEAKSQFDLLAKDDFASVPRNEQWSIAACLAADLCCWLRDESRAEILYQRLFPGRNQYCVIGFGVANFGSIMKRLAALAAVLHRWDLAEEHFEAAIRLEEHVGSLPWMAHAIYGYAQCLSMRGTRADVQRAEVLSKRGIEITHMVGMDNLTQKLNTLRLRNRQSGTS